MTRQVFVGVDLAKAFHQVAAVGTDQVLVVPPFRISRGRGGLDDMLARLRFLIRTESGLVFTIEATSDYWWELAWPLGERGCSVYLAHPKKAHEVRLRAIALHE